MAVCLHKTLPDSRLGTAASVACHSILGSRFLVRSPRASVCELHGGTRGSMIRSFMKGMLLVVYPFAGLVAHTPFLFASLAQAYRNYAQYGLGSGAMDGFDRNPKETISLDCRLGRSPWTSAAPKECRVRIGYRLGVEGACEPGGSFARQVDGRSTVSLLAMVLYGLMGRSVDSLGTPIRVLGGL